MKKKSPLITYISNSDALFSEKKSLVHVSYVLFVIFFLNLFPKITQYYFLENDAISGMFPIPLTRTGRRLYFRLPHSVSYLLFYILTGICLYYATLEQSVVVGQEPVYILYFIYKKKNLDLSIERLVQSAVLFSKIGPSEGVQTIEYNKQERREQVQFFSEVVCLHSPILLLILQRALSSIFKLIILTHPY